MKNQIVIRLLLLALSISFNPAFAQNAEIQLRSATAQFEKQTPLLFEVNVNNQLLQLYLDTATPTFLFPTAINNAENFGADKIVKNRSNTTMTAVSFSAPWFSQINRSVSVVPNGQRNYPQTAVGAIGIESFIDRPVTLHFDFENNIVTSFYGKDRRMLPLVGFEKIKCEIKNKQVYIFAVVCGKERKLLLDTGDNCGVKIPAAILNAVVKTEFQNTFANDGTLRGQENTSVKIGTITKLFAISSTGDTKSYGVGYAFIKQFNWVIDFEKHQVYIRKNLSNDVLVELSKN